VTLKGQGRDPDTIEPSGAPIGNSSDGQKLTKKLAQ